MTNMYIYACIGKYHIVAAPLQNGEKYRDLVYSEAKLLVFVKFTPKND